MIFWPLAQRKIDPEILGDFKGILEAKLQRQGLSLALLTDQLLEKLVREAYTRAGRDENDHVPRYGNMWKEIESIAFIIPKIYRGNNDCDLVLQGILNKYGYVHKKAIH